MEVRNIETKGEMHLAIYDDADVFENDNGEKGGAAKGTFYKAGNLGNELSKGYEAEITEIEFAE